MKKTLLFVIAVMALLASCNDYETYGDQKEKERNAISKFIADSSITVISEDQFVKQGYQTDLARNEFVKLDKSGIYMQIVRPGCGSKLLQGETATIICRYMEFNILTDTISSRNNIDLYSTLPDVMRVTNSSGSYSGSFLSGIMLNYGSAAVPAGWMVPLDYISIGRPQAMTDEISKVRLIIPHSQGHNTAMQSVIPYYYEITYVREA